MPRPNPLDPELLRRLYNDERMSTVAIGRKLGVTKGHVRLQMKLHGIDRRSVREANDLAVELGTKKGQIGPLSHAWKGGRKHHSSGYVQVMRKGHPEADRFGYVFEHRLVMEQALGRKLGRHEQVHHINEVRDDNRPENLEVLTISAHMRHHSEDRRDPRTGKFAKEQVS